MTLRAIPIDQTKLELFLCASAPAVRADPTTGEIRTDRISGEPIFLVGILVKVVGDRRAYVLDVQVPGEPAGLHEGAPVVMTDLEAAPWERDGRSGVTYRAKSITPGSVPAASPPVAATAAEASATGRAPGRSGGGS
ncbi:hypothetical protein KDL01_17480 [Actinospica durhamensis]|uniref:Uncharacterized protein n=1 Tax=Actinospica durhamensis TaxID=1508375 RepID=A0A941EQ27_9ACTN|nr:hypothetical protein [Actinospica durhamensis]MBR7835071.1 hypothetical protein [Actinospica durhamensis]